MDIYIDIDGNSWGKSEIIMGVRKIVRTWTPKSAAQFFVKVGRFFERPNSFPSHEATFNILKRMGHSPDMGIDVGAYQGEWTQRFSAAFPNAKMLMVEPQDSKQNALESLVLKNPHKIVLENTLLGAEDDAIVRFSEMETGSSVFEELSPVARCYVEKKQERLDSVLNRNPVFKKATFLKLDVQGYELEVLKGAEQLLKGLNFILMEVAVEEYNEGAPQFLDVLSFMQMRGFRFFDFCQQMRTPIGVLFQVDVLFVRDSLDLDLGFCWNLP